MRSAALLARKSSARARASLRARASSRGRRPRVRSLLSLQQSMTRDARKDVRYGAIALRLLACLKVGGRGGERLLPAQEVLEERLVRRLAPEEGDERVHLVPASTSMTVRERVRVRHRTPVDEGERGAWTHLEPPTSRISLR